MIKVQDLRIGDMVQPHSTNGVVLPVMRVVSLHECGTVECVIDDEQGDPFDFEEKDLTYPRKRVKYYFFVTSEGTVESCLDNVNGSIHNKRYEIGNYYVTEEDALNSERYRVMNTFDEPKDA